MANGTDIAAIASAVAAAISAASATFFGIRQSRRERNHLKIQVFADLLRERATMYSQEAVRALNIIDLTFADDKNVREAWSELYQVLSTASPQGPHLQLQNDKVAALLREMSIAVSLSGKLKREDFARIYFSNVLAKQQEISMLQQDIDLRRLREQLGSIAQESEFQLRFPPKPSP